MDSKPGYKRGQATGRHRECPRNLGTANSPARAPALDKERGPAPRPVMRSAGPAPAGSHEDEAGLISTPPIRFDSISMASDSDSIRLRIPIWIPISQRRPTSLPISADSTSPDPAADFRRSDSFRSPIRLIDSILGSPDSSHRTLLFTYDSYHS